MATLVILEVSDLAQPSRGYGDEITIVTHGFHSFQMDLLFSLVDSTSLFPGWVFSASTVARWTIEIPFI